MIIYECDNCKNQATGSFRRGDGLVQFPGSWSKIKTVVKEKTNIHQLHFCSIPCLQKFDLADYEKLHSIQK